MSLSLIGIIFIQVYWFNTSLEKNEEEFKFHVKQILNNVSQRLQKQEEYTFYNKYKRVKDSIGKNPEKSDLLEYGYYQRNSKTNETIIYSSSIIAEDYDIFSSFFDKSNKSDSVKIKNFTSNRKTEVYNGNQIDKAGIQKNTAPDLTIQKSGNLDILNDALFDISFKDIASTYPIQERATAENIKKLLSEELKNYGVNTPFEFNIYSNGLATKIKSDQFKYDKYSTYSIPIFVDNDGKNTYQLLTTFPQKKRFLFREIIGITSLSILFTLIIIIAYANALNQLIKQRQISEIKTDFINNMTHEFKTPIATINLALDAIKNPKIIDDKEKVFRYLQMIRDENKRMHAQVENVLRISKLEKRELDIEKESLNVKDIIDDAIEHVSLIVEDRNGKINVDYKANRNTVLANDVHFTNVIVNILDNAVNTRQTNQILQLQQKI
jgi:two-component system, OmpR family, phosphate regulon sensor histidine kinase PhoR